MATKLKSATNIGVCFICGGKPKNLVPGHKVCPTHHNAAKCNTCKKQGKPDLKNKGYIVRASVVS